MEKEYQVYFEGNFWGHAKGERPGRKIPVEKEFQWDQKLWRLPAVYSCTGGLAVIFCIRIPTREIRAFLEKWNSERRLSPLTHEEYEQMEQESPFSLDFRVTAKVNGRELERKDMCGTAWHPCGEEREQIDLEAEELMEAFGCDRQFGWYFVKTAFPWGTKSRPEIRSLSFEFRKNPVSVFGLRFSVKEGERERELSFVHPVTGQEHTLQILSCEQERLSDQSFPEREGWEFPGNCLVLTYRVLPEISGTDFRIQDCAESDPARKIVAEDRSGKVCGAVSAAILNRHEPDVCTVCSALHFEPVREAEWRMLFYRKDPKEFSLEVL
ncbi:MAG: hypothetical protein SOZ59_06985 [Candidatus Limivivens sp.]|nr:hypothetical protein [Candidatus Limivivens sp.]